MENGNATISMHPARLTRSVDGLTTRRTRFVR